MYFSFLELGCIALQSEDAWLPLFVKRTEDLKKYSANISQAFKQVLKLFFGELTANFATGGVELRLADGSHFRLFLILGMVLQDGGAHKLIWCNKGDAGMKMCILCHTFSKRSTILDEMGDHILLSSCIFEEDIHLASNADIKGAVQRLSVHRVTCANNDEFKMREQSCGFRYEPHGLLNDQYLEPYINPVDQFCHDWMHMLMVQGIFNTVMFLLLRDLAKAGVTDIYTQLETYLSTWNWPGNHAMYGVANIFSKKRQDSNNRAKTFKAAASECLTIYSVVCFFLMAVVTARGICKYACQAYIALCNMIDILVSSPLGTSTPDELRGCIRGFLQSCLDAGWEGYMQPKFHWLLHLPKHWERWKCLLTCWSLERKHRMVKRYAQGITNKKIYEKSVLGEVLSHTLTRLASIGPFFPGVCSLAGNTRPVFKAMVALLSDCFGIPITQEMANTSITANLVPAGSCNRKDVVLIKPNVAGGKADCGEVLFHADIMGEVVSMVSLWQLLAYDITKGSAEWQMQNNPTLVPTDAVICPVIHTVIRGSVARTLIPLSHRRLM